MNTKTCSKCKSKKLLTEFHYKANVKSKLTAQCKICIREHDKLRMRKKRKDPVTQSKLTIIRKDLVFRAKKAVYDAAYRKNNRAAYNFYAANRYAAKSHRTPIWLTDRDRKVIWGFYQIAAMLTKHNKEPWEVDHIIPLLGENVSGLHTPSNLQLLTKRENSSKNNRFSNEQVGIK